MADIAGEAGEIVLWRKADRVVKVFLGREITEHMRKWMGERTSGPLFATKDGRRLTSRQVARRFSQWIEKAGIKHAASPQRLRHSFATQMYARTHDILLVKEALRHRSITSTLVYARKDGDRVRSVMA